MGLVLIHSFNKNFWNLKEQIKAFCMKCRRKKKCKRFLWRQFCTCWYN